MRAAYGMLCLALLLGAGCASAPPAPSSVPTLPGGAHIQWQPLAVFTTPSEAAEAVGQVHLAWNDAAFAIYNQKETDLEHRTVVANDGIYTSNTGTGWTLQARSGLDDGSLSNRLVLWDLRTLLSAPGTTVSTRAAPDGTVNLTASGTYDPSGLAVPFALALELDATGHILGGRLESSAGREAPFRFAPLASPFEFAVQIPPGPVRPHAEAVRLDGLAYGAHARIASLVRNDTQRHAGVVPGHVDPQSLGLDLATCGCSWPDNPFGGGAVSDGPLSGQFRWTKCGPTDGLYVGSGWDGTVLYEAFGPHGCTAPGLLLRRG